MKERDKRLQKKAKASNEIFKAAAISHWMSNYQQYTINTTKSVLVIPTANIPDFLAEYHPIYLAKMKNAVARKVKGLSKEEKKKLEDDQLDIDFVAAFAKKFNLQPKQALDVKNPVKQFSKLFAKRMDNEFEAKMLASLEELESKEVVKQLYVDKMKVHDEQLAKEAAKEAAKAQKHGKPVAAAVPDASKYVYYTELQVDIKAGKNNFEKYNSVLQCNKLYNTLKLVHRKLYAMHTDVIDSTKSSAGRREAFAKIIADLKVAYELKLEQEKLAPKKEKPTKQEKTAKAAETKRLKKLALEEKIDKIIAGVKKIDDAEAAEEPKKKRAKKNDGEPKITYEIIKCYIEGADEV